MIRWGQVWLVLVSFSVAMLALIATWAFAPAVGSTSDEALYWSVMYKVGGSALFEPDGCARRRGTVWTCDILDAGGSGSVRFKVTRNGRCWRALREGPQSVEGPMPKRAHGCIKLHDQLRVGERLLDLASG